MAKLAKISPDNHFVVIVGRYLHLAACTILMFSEEKLPELLRTAILEDIAGRYRVTKRRLLR
jgi:hypothetical protein